MHGKITTFLPFEHPHNIRNLFNLDAFEVHAKILQNDFLASWSLICTFFNESFFLIPWSQ